MPAAASASRYLVAETGLEDKIRSSNTPHTEYNRRLLMTTTMLEVREFLSNVAVAMPKDSQ